jgi:hypothetical protein
LLLEPPPLALVAGARASPAEIGSEARPIWRLARLPAAIATAAATAMPSSARPIHLSVAAEVIFRAPL